MLHFDTDYMEGAHPVVMQRLVETNLEQTTGYGSDHYTQWAKEQICKAVGDETVDVHFLVGGTQTNSTVIDALLMHHQGVMCAETGHINVHESGAIESCGHKVLTLPSHQGKVCPAEVRDYITKFYADETFEHMVAPGMLYISYPTEYGTLYSRQELEELHSICQEHDIPLYIDGARLGYGLTSQECDITLQDMPKLCDIFYIGGTKCGAMFGECVVARHGLLRHFFPLIKQHGALLAKGRLLAIQFGTLFTDDLYQNICRHAVEMAMRLKEGFVQKGYQLFLDSPTNQQFFVLPNDIMDQMAQRATFEVWGTRGETHTTVRFVTSWATTEEMIDNVLNLRP